MSDHLLTPAEVAACLPSKLTRACIYKWMHDGYICGRSRFFLEYTQVGRRYRIRLSALREFLVETNALGTDVLLDLPTRHEAAQKKASKGAEAGTALAVGIVRFLHLMYQKRTALRVLSALIKHLREAKSEFET